MRKLIFSSLMIGLIALSGCYPGSDRTLDDTDLVYTNYDDNFDFQAKKTYYLVDEVISIDTNETIPQDIQNAILSKSKDEMEKRGYTRITAEDPDGIPSEEAAVVVMSSAVSGTVTGYDYWPGYGGWYGCWWGWCGWYPPYYGGIYVPYSYDVGTIHIDMFDRSSFDPVEENIDLVWTAVMNGVLSSTSAGTEQRINKVITQAFAQSPYL